MGASVAARWHVFPDLPAAAAALADRVVETGVRSFADRGSFRLVVSGGSSPIGMFRRLVEAHRSALPWRSVDLFWADERAVPPDDPESNYGLAERELLGPLGPDRPRTHRILGERRPIEEVARTYAREIVGPSPPTGPPTAPWFDHVVLGMGPDGHTASLFPGSPLLEAPPEEPVGVEPHPGRPPLVPRITLTLPALARSRAISFLVGGSDKRSALRAVHRPGEGGPVRPAGRVRAIGPVEWFVARDAAPDGMP